MLGTRLVVVADAHLGAGAPSDEEAFLDFVAAVPSLGDCLLINGDLFEFWFAYRRAVPRRSVRVAGALAVLARRMPVVMTGGNHDRWGDSFWDRDAGITFAPHETRFAIDGCEVLATHGDGLAEEHRSAAFMHRLTRHPFTAAAFRFIHPDAGIWLVDRISRFLADSTRDPAVLERAEIRQREWAHRRLETEPGLGLVVMAHTHRAVLTEPAPGRRYLNPGAWLDGYRYAVVTAAGAELRQFRPGSATA
ncbi:MAG: UDP-2,3-diacylglucosamine diphosphatase [Gemmatimonadales bacterium]